MQREIGEIGLPERNDELAWRRRRWVGLSRSRRGEYLRRRASGGHRHVDHFLLVDGMAGVGDERPNRDGRRIGVRCHIDDRLDTSTFGNVEIAGRKGRVDLDVARWLRATGGGE